MKPHLRIYMFLISTILVFFLFANNALGQTPEKSTLLQLDSSINSKINPGETHAYTLKLASNSSFHVILNQKNIDLKMELSSPTGELINYINGSTNINSSEDLLDSVIDAGEYTLRISSVDTEVPSGEYELKLEGVTPNTDINQKRILARKLFMDTRKVDAKTESEKIESVNNYLRSSSLYTEVGDVKRAADILSLIGDIYLTGLTDSESAVFYYRKSLLLYEKIGDNYGCGNILNNLGYTFKLLKDYQNSLENYQKCIYICKEILRDDYETALSEYNLGGVYAAQNNFEKAQGYYVKSISILKGKQFFYLCGFFSKKLADIYIQNNDKKKILETYDDEIKYFTLCKNLSEVALAFNHKGDILKDLYDKQNSLNSYQEALTIYKQINDKNSEAVEMNNIGSVYDVYGETHQAIKYYEDAYNICSQLDNNYLKSIVLNNLGLGYSSTRQYEKAFSAFQKSLDILKTEKNNVDALAQVAVTTSNLAATYNEIGNPELSEQYYSNALSIFKSLGGRKYNEAITLSNLGSIYVTLAKEKGKEKEKQAEESFLKALDLFKEVDSRKGQAVSLSKLADLKLKNKSYQEALALLNEALALRHAINDRLGEVYTLNLLGLTQKLLGEKQTALRIYNDALALSREFFDDRAELITIYNLALFENEQNNFLTALDHLEIGINKIESTTSTIKNKQFQSTFFANNEKFYELYINTLMNLHKIYPKKDYNIKAFEASEKARARVFLELINDDKKQEYLGVSSETLKRFYELQSQLSFLGEQLIKLKNTKNRETEVTNLENTFTSTKSELQILQIEMNSSNAKKVEMLALSQIQNKILDSNTVLVEYALGEKTSYVWLATKTDFFSYELPSRTGIEQIAENMYSDITAPNHQIKFETDVQRIERLKLAEKNYSKNVVLLSEILLPYAEKIGRFSKILISPDGKLEFMPFTALIIPNTNSLLISRYDIINVSSASSIMSIDSRKNIENNRILVLADPIFETKDSRIAKVSTLDSIALNTQIDSAFNTRGLRDLDIRRLPGTKKEAVAISEPFKGQTDKLTDSEATKKNFIERAGRYGYLHLATHAIQNPNHPELSCVVFSLVDENGKPIPGFLTVDDILKLNLFSRLVVLSACETALGTELKGTGVISLGSAFIRAGTAQVVSSLWSINDNATAEFMAIFYAALKAGHTPASALRISQMKFLKSGRSPYYWAAFKIEGGVK